MLKRTGYSGDVVFASNYTLSDVVEPETTGALQKAGWIKATCLCDYAQRYETVVACDLDLVFLRNPEQLSMLPPGLYMAEDPGKRTYRSIPECGVEMNSGLILCREISPTIFFLKFAHLWKKYKNSKAARRAYYDEIIATAAWRLSDGKLLDRKWNHSHTYADEPTHTLHGHGQAGKQTVRALYDKIMGQKDNK
jgi:hypothetical protein